MTAAKPKLTLAEKVQLRLPLSFAEISAAFGIAQATLAARCAAGEFTYIDAGIRSRVMTRDQIDKMLQQMTREATGPTLTEEEAAIEKARRRFEGRTANRQAA